MVHTVSFKHAFDGLLYTFKTQPNMRFHGFFGGAVVIAGWYFGITIEQWLIVIFTMLLMLTAEMVNTSIESMTDLIKKEYSQQAKIAKDVAAGMVLLNAIGSVVIGIIIFGPKVISLFIN
jgi:diacylglycerol kinase